MAYEMSEVMLYVMPAIKTIVYLLVGGGFVLGLAYYLFIIKRRKTWNVSIWEQKADGRIHLISKDKLTQKRINKGQNILYTLKFARSEVLPPPWEGTYRIRNKEYVDYLRIEDEYVPLAKHVDGSKLWASAEQKKGFIQHTKALVYAAKSMGLKEIETRYIHVPIHNILAPNMVFKTMDYDVNLMRINSIEIRDKIYSERKDFWNQYGQIIALGAIITLIIVVLYMSYEYSSGVIDAAMGKAAETLSMVEALSERMSGTPG